MRNPAVDTAKGIAILFVVLGHCNSHLTSFFYSFHVQFFFLVSGFLFTNKYATVSKYVQGGGKKLVVKLLIPYFIFAFIYGRFDIKHLILYSWGSNQTMIDTPGHLWFLPAFFVAAILFHIIEIVAKERKPFEVLYCIICLLFAWLTSYQSNLSLNVFSHTISLTDVGGLRKDHLVTGFPFGFNIALMGTSLMIIGKLLRDATGHINFQKCIITLPIVVVSFAIGFVCYYFNQQPAGLFYQMKCNMSFAEYGDFGFFLGSSVFLGVTLLLMSHLIQNTLLAKIGSLSMIVYLIHPFFIGMTNSLLSYMKCDLSGISAGGDLLGIIVFILTVIATLVYDKIKIKFQYT